MPRTLPRPHQHIEPKRVWSELVKPLGILLLWPFALTLILMGIGVVLAYAALIVKAGG